LDTVSVGIFIDKKMVRWEYRDTAPVEKETDAVLQGGVGEEGLHVPPQAQGDVQVGSFYKYNEDF
jgi:hypothetical protein